MYTSPYYSLPIAGMMLPLQLLYCVNKPGEGNHSRNGTSYTIFSRHLL